MGIEFHFCNMIDNDGCTTVWIYLMPSNLKMATIMNFVVCISHNKKIKIEKKYDTLKGKKHESKILVNLSTNDINLGGILL